MSNDEKTNNETPETELSNKELQEKIESLELEIKKIKKLMRVLSVMEDAQLRQLTRIKSDKTKSKMLQQLPEDLKTAMEGYDLALGFVGIKEG